MAKTQLGVFTNTDPTFTRFKPEPLKSVLSLQSQMHRPGNARSLPSCDSWYCSRCLFSALPEATLWSGAHASPCSTPIIDDPMFALEMMVGCKVGAEDVLRRGMG